MKLFFVFILSIQLLNAQTWTSAELAASNTCASATYLTSLEKEVIKYLNLARLYPKKYALIELNDQDKTTTYYKSLIKKLNSMSPVSAISPDKKSYESAKCLSNEQSKSGKTGHDRKSCGSYFYGECCSYGMFSGSGIVAQLLVDNGVPSLGHREMCLSYAFSKVGVSCNTHKVYSHCCVLDFN